MATIAYEYETTSGMSKVVDMSSIRSLTEEDLEGSFYINITNGYIIRSLIHMLRDIMLYAILELTPKRVRILRYDGTGKIIIHLELLASRFHSYFFKSKKSTIKIGLEFMQIWNKMKILAKPDPFIMYKPEGKDYMILDFGSMAEHRYNLQGVVDQHITLPEYSSPSHNINLSVRKLSRAMTALRTNKTKTIFKGYKDRLTIETPKKQTDQKLGSPCYEFWDKLGITASQLAEELRESSESSDEVIYCSMSLSELENLEDNEVEQNERAGGDDGGGNEEPLVTLEQVPVLLKSLAKVCNISDDSPIRITTEQGKPIKMVISIYQYGLLTFYLFKDPQSGAMVNTSSSSSCCAD